MSAPPREFDPEHNADGCGECVSNNHEKDTYSRQVAPVKNQQSQRLRSAQRHRRSAAPSISKWRASPDLLTAGPTTTTLAPAAVIEMRAAAAHAEHIDRPLNTYVTIDWFLGPPSSATGTEMFNGFRRRLLPQLRRWAASAGDDPAEAQLVYIGVHEAPDGLIHTHLAIHFPAAVRSSWGAMVATLRRLAFGHEPIPANALMAKRIVDLDGLISYLSKGVSPEHHNAFGVRPGWRAPQGTLAGKRFAISTATLGAAARARWAATQGHAGPQKRRCHANQTPAGRHPAAFEWPQTLPQPRTQNAQSVSDRDIPNLGVELGHPTMEALLSEPDQSAVSTTSADSPRELARKLLSEQ